MSQVFLQKPMAPDVLLGRVEDDGKVYRNRLGPDELVGHVDLESGHIFRDRLGPDEYAGRVEPGTGRVFRQVPLGLDEYLGHVDGQGRCYRQKPMAPDEYIGAVKDMKSYAHAGAAFLLLLWPAEGGL